FVHRLLWLPDVLQRSRQIRVAGAERWIHLETLAVVGDRAIVAARVKTHVAHRGVDDEREGIESQRALGFGDRLAVPFPTGTARTSAAQWRSQDSAPGRVRIVARRPASPNRRSDGRSRAMRAARATKDRAPARARPRRGLWGRRRPATWRSCFRA